MLRQSFLFYCINYFRNSLDQSFFFPSEEVKEFLYCYSSYNIVNGYRNISLSSHLLNIYNYDVNLLKVCKFFYDFSDVEILYIYLISLSLSTTVKDLLNSFLW